MRLWVVYFVVCVVVFALSVCVILWCGLQFIQFWTALLCGGILVFCFVDCAYFMCGCVSFQICMID